VYPGVKLFNPLKRNALCTGGGVWVHVPTGQRFIAKGVTSKTYLYSPMLDGIVGKFYVRPDQCKRIIHNEGIVVWS